MAVKNRALAIATAGILTGAAISIATQGLIQLPTGVVVTPVVPVEISGGGRIQRGPIELVYPQKYELTSRIQFMLRSLSYFDYEPAPLHIYNTRSHAVQILASRSNLEIASNVESLSSLEVLLSANSVVEYSAPASVTGHIPFVLEANSVSRLDTPVSVSGNPVLALNIESDLENSYEGSGLVENSIAGNSLVENSIIRENEGELNISLEGAGSVEFEAKPQTRDVESLGIFVLDSRVGVARELAKLGLTEFESEAKLKFDGNADVDIQTVQASMFNHSQNVVFKLRGAADIEAGYGVNRMQSEDDTILALFAHIMALMDDN